MNLIKYILCILFIRKGIITIKTTAKIKIKRRRIRNKVYIIVFS